MTDDLAPKIWDCVEYEHITVDPAVWVTENHRAVFSSELNGRNILQASVYKGQFRLQATSYVGIIPLTDSLMLRVRPRFPIANLTRMVADTGHEHVEALSAFRDYSSEGSADDWERDLYTEALLDYVDDVIDRGLMRAYERREGEGQFPLGAVNPTRLMQRFAARGVPNRAAYTWFERTVDVPANRCLKAAMQEAHAHLVKRRPQQRKGGVKRLARLIGQMAVFDEVGDDPDLHFMDDPQVLGLEQLPDSRSYYRPALDLARTLIEGVGITLDVSGTDVRLASQLVDTSKLFERFVRVSLERYALRHDWPVEVLDGNSDGAVDFYDVPDPLPSPLGHPMTSMASRNAGKAQPDVVLRGADGTHPLVAEVKNKTSGDDSLPLRDDVEQAVTYALRYDLRVALLIHPWSQGTKDLVYVGRVNTIDVYDYRLDLSTQEGLDAALDTMGQAIGRLASLS